MTTELEYIDRKLNAVYARLLARQLAQQSQLDEESTRTIEAWAEVEVERTRKRLSLSEIGAMIDEEIHKRLVLGDNYLTGGVI